MKLRVGTYESTKLVLDTYREGAFDQLLHSFIGKYRKDATFALSNDLESYDNIPEGYKFYGTFRLYETNESDFNMENYLPASDQLELADFVFTTIQAEIYILSKFDLRTGVADMTKMFFFDNTLLAFCLLVVSWVATMAALKLVNLDLKGTCLSFKEKIAGNEENPKQTSLFYHFSFMLLQGLPSLATRTSPRLVSVAFQFFTMIVIYAIYANIKTQLMTVDNSVISNLYDLVEKNPNVKFTLYAQDPICDYLKHSSGIYQKFWEQLNKPSNVYVMSDKDFMRGMRQMRTSSDYAFLVESMMSYIVVEHLNYFNDDTQYFIGREELPGIYAMSYRKGLDNDVKQYLHRRLSSLVESGLKRALYEKILEVNVSPQKFLTDVSDAINLDAEEALALKHFSTTFFIWMGGLGISALCFLGELITYAHSRCFPRLTA